MNHPDDFLELVFQNDSKKNVKSIEVMLGDFQMLTRNLPEGQSRRMVCDAEPPEIARIQMSTRVQFEDGTELSSLGDRPRNGEKITVFIKNDSLSFRLNRAAAW